MPTMQLLDVPAGTVSEADENLLLNYPAKDRPYGMALIAYPHGSGFTVSTSQMKTGKVDGDTEDFLATVRKEGFSEGFVYLLRRATDLDADLIRIGHPGIEAETLRPFLDASTGHVTFPDNEKLEAYPADRSKPGSVVDAHPYEYGWTVNTEPMLGPGRDAFLAAVRAEGFSEPFVQLLERAAERGEAMMRLDSSGDQEPGMMYYDWTHDSLPYDPEEADGAYVAPAP